MFACTINMTNTKAAKAEFNELLERLMKSMTEARTLIAGQLNTRELQFTWDKLKMLLQNTGIQTFN